MPLINKQPFKPNPIPDNLGPDDEVFYHELTNEIFTSHDAFFDRFLFCNSLIWTCSKTGKSGLTYAEALESEQQEATKKKRKKIKRERAEETEGGGDGSEPIKKKKKKYPYDPKKYSMPVPEGFDPSLLTPTGKIDGRKLKSKKNKQLAEELLLANAAAAAAQQNSSPEISSKRGPGKHKKKEDEAKRKEEETKKKEEDAKRKAQMQAELAKERELEAKRKKEAAALVRQLERQKKEEERKKAAAFLQNWEKKCEDLERDDLRKLPQPTPLNCDIPEKLFGDAIFIMESLYNLHDLYLVGSVFPEGVSYDALEEMLLDRQEDGPLGTVIQFLLRLIFDTQPTGDGYGLDDDPSKTTVATTGEVKQELVKANHIKQENTDADGRDHDHEQTNGLGSEGHESDEDDENVDKDVNMNDLIGSAIKAAQEVKKTLSKPLPEVELDSTNLTEILKLHLLQSGSFPKGRTIYNGWYSSREDPGLWLCMQEPDLIKKLGEVTIYDLEIEERIKILHTLIYQLFTFIKTRGYIEAASEQLTELRKSYRHEAATFARWDRENCVKRMQPPKRKGELEASGNTSVQQQPTNNDKESNNINNNNNHEILKICPKTEEGAASSGDAPHNNDNDDAQGEKPQNGTSDESEQNFEELERAYQQNMVDYEDYQRERAIRFEHLNETLLSIRKTLRSTQSIYGVHPIGRDRAYRRYWLFESLPGLFVEQDEEHIGKCLQNPTPLESQYKKLFNKENPLIHPNEDDFVRTTITTTKQETTDPSTEAGKENQPEEVAAAEQQHLHNGHEEADTDENPGEPQDDQEAEPSGISDDMNICTGDESTCAIHGQKRSTQTRWWFYHTSESIDALIEGLNKRGYRESELQDTLSTESSLIKPWVTECPAYKLNKSILEQSGIRRSRRLRTKGSKRRGRTTN